MATYAPDFMRGNFGQVPDIARNNMLGGFGGGMDYAGLLNMLLGGGFGGGGMGGMMPWQHLLSGWLGGQMPPPFAGQMPSQMQTMQQPFGGQTMQPLGGQMTRPGDATMPQLPPGNPQGTRSLMPR